MFIIMVNFRAGHKSDSNYNKIWPVLDTICIQAVATHIEELYQTYKVLSIPWQDTVPNWEVKYNTETGQCTYLFQLLMNCAGKKTR